MRGGKIGRHWAGRRHNRPLNKREVPTYYRNDGGCPKATEFLKGEQSHCLSCPFEKCKEE